MGYPYKWRQYAVSKTELALNLIKKMLLIGGFEQDSMQIHHPYNNEYKNVNQHWINHVIYIYANK